MKSALIALIILFLQASTAKAGLGEDQSSVERDKARFLFDTHTTESHSHYNVHTLSKSGMTIREYADLKGKIFAIAWKGHAHPDLTALLGPYLKEFRNISQTQNRNSSSRRFGYFNGKFLTAERSGILRASRGRAYIVSLFPQDVTLGEIK